MATSGGDFEAALARQQVEVGRWLTTQVADPHLAEGLNVHEGQVTYEAVATELGYDYRPTAELLR